MAKKAKETKKEKELKTIAKTEAPKAIEAQREMECEPERQDASGRPMTYYIDFENVHGDGLKGVNELPESAEVFVFYSKAAETFHIQQAVDIMASKARIVFVECDSGTRNSLDFQLVAALFGTMSADREYAIVSGDAGFDAAIKMAERLGLSKVSRFADVSGTACNQGKPKSQRRSRQRKTTISADSPEPAQDGKPEQPAKPEQSEHADHPEAEQRQTAQSQAQAAPVQDKPAPAPAPEKTQPANEPAAQKLSNRQKVAKELESAGVVLKREQLSTVMSALNETKDKQSFYRAIIAKEGKQRGLELYHRVRGSYKALLEFKG